MIQNVIMNYNCFRHKIIHTCILAQQQHVESLVTNFILAKRAVIQMRRVKDKFTRCGIKKKSVLI